MCVQLGDRKFYSDKMKALMKTSKWKNMKKPRTQEEDWQAVSRAAQEKKSKAAIQVLNTGLMWWGKEAKRGVRRELGFKKSERLLVKKTKRKKWTV